MQDNNLFSGGQADPNAGASGNFNNNQINPQAMAALQQLIQSSQQQQNAPAMSLTNGGVGNAQGQQVDPQMQKSAVKALQGYYDDHAQQALTHPDGIKALSAIANQGQENQKQVQQNNQPTPNPNGNYQPQDILSKLLGGIGITPTPQNQLLSAEAQGMRQKIGAGQPSEIAKPQAEAAAATSESEYYGQLSKEINQKITKGGPPLSPTEQANFTAGINNLGIKQVTDLQDNLQKQADVTLKQLEAKIENTPQSQKIGDWVNYNNQIKSLHGKLAKINGLMGGVNDTLKNKKFTDPNTGQPINVTQSNSSSPKTSEMAQKIEGAVYKDANGNTAKYVNGQYVPVSRGNSASF